MQQSIDATNGEALRMSQEQLAFALDAGGGVGAWDWDILLDRVYADSRFAQVFSVDPERAAHGAPIADFVSAVHPEDQAHLFTAIETTVKTGGDFSAEFRIQQKDSSVRWFYARGRCHLNEAGVAERFPGVVFDITDRHNAEELMADTARHAALGSDVGAALAQIAALPTALQLCAEAIVKHLDAAFARIWTLDASGNVLELQASAGLYTHLNGPHSRVPVGSYKIGQIAQERKPHLTNDVLNDPRVGDREWARREGMVAFAGYPLIVEDRLVGVVALFARQALPRETVSALASVCTSIALGIERKRAEAALRNSEERYRFLAESMPQMVWTATPEGALDYVNNQATAYFGVTAEDLLGAGWLGGVHSEDRDSVINRWQHSLTTGEPYEAEFRLRRGADGAWRWFLARAHSMFKTNGSGSQVAGWVGTCTDIHEQKSGQNALAKANRELEEFAYVASHDLQEPLRMVNIYTQMLLRRFSSDDPKLIQYAGFINQGVNRMEALIGDLLSFSRSVHAEAPTSGTADLEAALKEALAVLEPRIVESGVVIKAGPLPCVRGETQQLAHVFQNLLGNSIKYRQRAMPEIRITAEEKDSNWIICVRDNGIGFDQAYAERIFGLFKRLHKDEYPGTGLGLAICQRIVERYGGRIWAEGKPGDGAAFSFSLPCVEPSISAAAEASPHRPL